MTCSVSAPANGQMGGCNSTLTHGQECDINCNDGYSPNGTMHCDGGNLTEATCSPDGCKSISKPQNGQMGSCNNEMASGGECQYACDYGYEATDAEGKLSDGTIFCNLGNLTEMTCEPKTCSVSAPANGQMGSCNNRLASGAECQLQCSSGYEAVYNSATVSLSDGTISCDLGNLTEVSCEPARCQLDSNALPSNGNMGSCSSGELMSGDECDIQCDTGYEPRNKATTISCAYGNLTEVAASLTHP